MRLSHKSRGVRGQRQAEEDSIAAPSACGCEPPVLFVKSSGEVFVSLRNLTTSVNSRPGYMISGFGFSIPLFLQVGHHPVFDLSEGSILPTLSHPFCQLKVLSVIFPPDSSSFHTRCVISNSPYNVVLSNNNQNECSKPVV